MFQRLSLPGFSMSTSGVPGHAFLERPAAVRLALALQKLDRLLGRAEAVWSTFAVATATIAPLVMGVLIENVSARAAVAVSGALALALAVTATLSPAIRAAPGLAELGEPAVAGMDELERLGEPASPLGPQ